MPEEKIIAKTKSNNDLRRYLADGCTIDGPVARIR